MKRADLLEDAVIGAAAGLAASKAMSPVTTKMYEQQTEASKQQERDVSYGVAYEVAAERTARSVGVELSDEQASRAGIMFHYGLGLAWAPVYMALRRSTPLTPWGAGLAAGLSLYAIVDEALNPLLGFTPPPQKYPLVTHLRGLVGHLAFGLVLAAAAEAGWALLGRRPR